MANTTVHLNLVDQLLHGKTEQEGRRIWRKLNDDDLDIHLRRPYPLHVGFRLNWISKDFVLYRQLLPLLSRTKSVQDICWSQSRCRIFFFFLERRSKFRGMEAKQRPGIYIHSILQPFSDCRGTIDFINSWYSHIIFQRYLLISSIFYQWRASS